jgi:hypothetical protein
MIDYLSGFIPRLLFQISTIILANTIAYQLRQFSKNEEKIVKYTDTLSSVLAFVITSPLSVVTTISSISGSELVAATPPNMPRYRSWISVLNHLYENVRESFLHEKKYIGKIFWPFFFINFSSFFCI